MSRSFDTVIIGAGADSLVAAIVLARSGEEVLVLESSDQLGGCLREIEFVNGFRVAPLSSDAGYWARELSRITGLQELPHETAPSASLVAPVEGEPLLLHRDIGRTAQGLSRLSARDAERWPAFVTQIKRFADFLKAIYRQPVPYVGDSSMSGLLAIAGFARRFHALGKRDMAELLRVLPMSAADWLDDWFESVPLKGLLAALAVTDVAQGPMSGGTAFTFLHRHVGAPRAVLGERLRLKGGPGALIDSLRDRAIAAGAKLETSVTVERVLVREGQVTGVVAASGEEISCRHVLSSLDPRRSLLELLDPAHLEVEFIEAIRHIRFRGVSTKVLLALDGLPAAAAALSGGLVIAPSIDYVEKAYDASKYGRSSAEPIIEVRFPSVTQANLAPPGKHVGILHVQFTPYGCQDSIGDRAIRIVERYLPGLTALIRERLILPPHDLERRFGLPEGAVSQGETMLDQILFMRPTAGWSRYEMPIRGYYLCGPGAHPGPGISGMSGWHAAKRMQRG